MEMLPRQVYTNEFRQQAVEMITRDGLSIAEAARRLAIAPRRAVTDAQAELSRLRREVAELRMERDILKNRRRTFPASRGKVRADEKAATRVPGASFMLRVVGLSERLLCMAHKRAIAESAATCAVMRRGAGGARAQLTARCVGSVNSRRTASLSLSVRSKACGANRACGACGSRSDFE